MTKSLARLALVFILVSLACSFPVSADLQPTPQAVSQLFVTADPNATATPTPFQPVGPTITPLPTEPPAPTVTPEPDLADVPSVPTVIRISQDLPEGTLNMLVLGSDWRPGGGYRTDVILFVSINSGKGTVSVVSFPRDLYVTIPGWGTDRINTAFSRGSFPMLADTFEYNFGVRPTHYVMTNFQGFTSIIDNLGGINVNIGQSLTDKCDLPQAVNTYCTVNPGVLTMDGPTALWYVRSRHSTSDFDRGRRAQEVLYAMFAKLMSLNAITRLPELYTAYQSSVETNLSVDVMAPLMPLATQVLGDSNSIQRYTIGPGEASPFTTSGGAMVLLPNYPAITAILNRAVFGE